MSGKPKPNQSNEFVMIYEDSKTAKYFKYGSGSYLDYFLDETVTFDDNTYRPRVRMYSNGSSDTAYFRKGEKYYYHYDKEVSTENIELPIDPKEKDYWIEADSSWDYTVLKMGVNFKTPIKNYKDCVLLQCRQLKGRDKNKSQIYFLYYCRGFGYVGNSSKEGRVYSYLKELKYNAKSGHVIGK